MDVAELLRVVIPMLVEAVGKGDSTGALPLRVLAAVKQLTEAGGRIGLEEATAILRALGVAASREIVPAERLTLTESAEQLSDFLQTSFAQPLPVFGTDWETPVVGPIEFGARFLGAVDESEGLEWNVRCIKSGLTLDKRHNYGPDAVRASASLFEGVQCFADHAPVGHVPEVGKLVGWYSNPVVTELDGGHCAVDAVLHAFENTPYSGLLREAYNRGGAAIDALGFSINGTGSTKLVTMESRTVKDVQEIATIGSVDLVSKPNAGGKLLALRAAVYEAADALPEVTAATANTETTMTEKKKNEEGELEEGNETLAASVQASLEEANTLRDELRAELEALRLSAARTNLVTQYGLPEQAIAPIQEQLSTAETPDAIEGILKMAQSVWSAAEEVRASTTTTLTQVDTPERNLLALQGMIAREAIDDVPPFRSLRQAYAAITGTPTDQLSPGAFGKSVIQASQGFDSELAPLQETVKTTDWARSLGMVLHRELIRQYNLPQWQEWKLLVSEIGNLNDMRTVDRLRTGFFDTIPTVAEGGTYQDLTDPTEERAYFAPTKRGGFASFTWESAVNDDLRSLRLIPQKLAISAKVTLWYAIMNIFASATPPTCSYDSVALFHASHSNLGTADLAASAWAACIKALRTMTVTGNSSIYLGNKPKYLLVPPDLEATALKLLHSTTDLDASTNDPTNIYKDSFEEPIIIPFWSDTDAWAAVVDPALVPTIEVGFLGGREDPEMFTEAANSGSGFTADKVVYKLRHVWGYCILDHRGMYKSNGAG